MSAAAGIVKFTSTHMAAVDPAEGNRGNSIARAKTSITPFEEALLWNNNSTLPGRPAPGRRQPASAAAVWAGAEGGAVPHAPQPPGASSRGSAQKRSAQAAALGRAGLGYPSRLLRSASAADLYNQPEGRVHAGRARGSARKSAQLQCLAQSFDAAFLADSTTPAGLARPAHLSVDMLACDEAAALSMQLDSLAGTTEGPEGVEVMEGKVRGGLSQGTRSSAAWGSAHDLLKRQRSTPVTHDLRGAGAPTPPLQPYSMSLDGLLGVPATTSCLSLTSLHSLDTLMMLSAAAAGEGEGKVRGGAGVLEGRVRRGQSLRSPRLGTSAGGAAVMGALNQSSTQSFDSGLPYDLPSPQPYPATPPGGDGSLLAFPLSMNQDDSTSCRATPPHPLSMDLDGGAGGPHQAGTSATSWAPEGMFINTLPKPTLSSTAGSQVALSSLPGASLAYLDRTLTDLTAQNNTAACGSSGPEPSLSGGGGGGGGGRHAEGAEAGSGVSSQASLVSTSVGYTSANASLASMAGSSLMFEAASLPPSHPTSPGPGSAPSRATLTGAGAATFLPSKTAGTNLGSISAPGVALAHCRVFGGGLFKVVPAGTTTAAAGCQKHSNPSAATPPATAPASRSLSSGGLQCLGSWDQPLGPVPMAHSAAPSSSLPISVGLGLDRNSSSSSLQCAKRTGGVPVRTASAALPSTHFRALVIDAVGSLTTGAGTSHPPLPTSSPPPVSASGGAQAGGRSLSPFAATTAQLTLDPPHCHGGLARTRTSPPMIGADFELPLRHANEEPEGLPRPQPLQRNLSSGNRTTSAGITFGAAAAALAAATSSLEDASSSGTTPHRASSAQANSLSLLEYAEEVSLRTSLTQSAAALLSASGTLPSPLHMPAHSRVQAASTLSPTLSGLAADPESDALLHMSGSFSSLPSPGTNPQQPGSFMSFSTRPGGTTVFPLLMGAGVSSMLLDQTLEEEEEEGEGEEQEAGKDQQQQQQQRVGGDEGGHPPVLGHTQATSAPSFTTQGWVPQLNPQGCIAGAGPLISLSMPLSTSTVATLAQGHTGGGQGDSWPAGVSHPPTPRLPLGVLADELQAARGHILPRFQYLPHLQEHTHASGSHGTSSCVSSLRQWAGGLSEGPGPSSQTSATTVATLSEHDLSFHVPPGPSQSTRRPGEPGAGQLPGAATSRLHTGEDGSHSLTLSMCDDIDATELASARQRVLQEHCKEK